MVYLYLLCERVIDHGLGTMKFKRRLHIWPWKLEPSRSRSKQRSWWKELMKVYLHLMCERVIGHSLCTMKLNVNYTFDLETWKRQGQGRRLQVPIETTHQGLSTSDVRVIDHDLDAMKFCQLHIWPWNFEHSRSRSQTKVPMERTHQGLSTSDVWKSYWPWSRYNEFKTPITHLTLNLGIFKSKSQTKVQMETSHEGISTPDVWKSYWPYYGRFELHVVRTDLHLVTYLKHCSRSGQLFCLGKWWRRKQWRTIGKCANARVCIDATVVRIFRINLFDLETFMPCVNCDLDLGDKTLSQGHDTIVW